MTADILQNLLASVGADMQAFLPELVLCGTIILMLFMRLFPMFDRQHMGWVALVFTFIALLISWQQWNRFVGYDPRDANQLSLELFSGLLVYDNFTIYLRLFLLAFTLLVILLTLFTGVPDSEDSADFFTLLLGSVVGMSMMASANHLLIVFLAIEMASLPSYALAGFLKGKRQSSEAALKYVVYGGGAAGVMLYGISLLAGKFGTAYVPDLLQFISAGPVDAVVLMGVLFVLVGIAFKLAAVPFHFWCPDVFEGASAEVAAFLSVASKGAALALLARFTLGLAGLTGDQAVPAGWLQATPYLVPALGFLAAVTMTFGNLAAYGQTNLKRLLAYSTIAHAGFMMLGLAAMTRDGAGAVLFYLVIYLFMNLGAFAVVAMLRNLTGSEDLRDFRGLVYRNPLLVITLAIFLLSLVGLPPMGGFAAKFQIFSALYHSAQDFSSLGHSNESQILYALLVLGGLNTAISLFYYVRVLRVMILERPLEVVENRPVAPLPTPTLPNLFLALLAGVVLYTGLFWGPLHNASLDKGVDAFHVQRAPANPKVAQAEPGAER